MLTVELGHSVGGFELDARFVCDSGITVLVGPSGAGKSMTLRMISGIDRPDRGRVAIDGVTLVDTSAGVHVSPQDRWVGVVFQDSLLLPHRTMLDNVALAVREGSRAHRRETAAGWLGEVGAADLAERRPGQVSGGQMQRVALARALAGDPRMLLLDEPFSALDLPVRHRLRILVKDIVARWEVPVLFVTHDSQETLLLGDRIHVLEEGRITQSGTPDDLRLKPRTGYAAALAGVNLFSGVAGGGRVELDGHLVHLADRDLEGPVVVTIPTSAPSVHLDRPSGSTRNQWVTLVERLEPIGDRLRLQTGRPLPLTVEITRAAAEELGVEPGSEIWLGLKATEIGVEPAGRHLG